MTSFPHLHVRSVHAPLASTVKLADLVAAQGSGPVCVTDPNLWGAMKLHKLAGERQVVGAEVTFAELPGHVVLLCKDAAGWANLKSIMAHPRPALGGVDLAGLAVLTGGAGGALCRALLPGTAEGITATVLDALDTAHADVWVELAPTMGERWRALWGLAATRGYSVVATGDVSYLRREDRESWRVLRAIAEKRRSAREEGVGGQDGVTWGHLASAEEVVEFFADCPAAVEGARELADLCQFRLSKAAPAMPEVRGKDGDLMDGRELRYLAEWGLKDRLGDPTRQPPEAYRQRLDYELGVIEQTGFPTYFLVVEEFVRWAKKEGIPVGPGRGSAAGSVVAWALGITDVDPLHYGLMFERFMNPERSVAAGGGGLPDIDLDLCKRGRQRVIEHLRQQYGQDSVGQILTETVLGGKSAIKDVGRALGVSWTVLNSALAPAPKLVNGKQPTVAWLVANVPALRDAGSAGADAGTAGAHGVMADVVRHALALEGCVKNSGVHPSGIVVSRGPLRDYVPTCRVGERVDKKTGAVKDPGELATQWTMEEVEDAGLVKFDLLGLTTVTHLALAEEMIGGGFRTDSIPLDDAATYALIARADTAGVFQLGNGGMQRMLRELRPDRFGDVVAACALYRPGPLKSGMVRDYVERKHGRQRVEAIHPILDEITKPTYSTIVYQEQVMGAVRAVAGYSLGAADIIRKIMGKKKPELLKKERVKFVAAAERAGTCDRAVAERIWAVVEANSGYSFNLAHSVCYGLLSYRAAWLKAHHPAVFYASWMSVLCEEQEKFKKLAAAYYDARASGVEVLPPDVNASGRDFAVVYDDALERAQDAPGGARGGRVATAPGPVVGAQPRTSQTPQCVSYGLGGLRGIGDAAIGALLAERQRGGPYSSMADLLRRVALGKRDLVALLGSGACDGVLAASAITRAQALASVVAWIKWSKAERKRRAGGQLWLFG